MLNRQAAASAGRFAIALALGLGIGTHEVFQRYKTYWNQTIYRVQTVDFNILAHTLPTKLSYALVQNQPKELQRTLDSNYSLFGLVVTDSSGQKILSSSGAGTTQKRSWTAALEPQQLQKYPYDLLLNPPPLMPQGNYSDPRDRAHQATGLKNLGRVIGRVYYVRGVPPSFQQDFWSWLRQPFAPSSRFQVYTPTMVSWLGAGLFTWLLSEWILQTKRRQKRLAQQREQELVQRQQQLVEDTKTQLNAKEEENRRLLSEVSQHAKQYAELLEVAERNTPLSQFDKERYERQIEEYQSSKEALEHELEETGKLRKDLEVANQQLKDARGETGVYKEHLDELIRQLEESVEAAHEKTLHWFERSVLQKVKKSSNYRNKNWSIRTGLDVSRGNGYTLETDLIVISSYSIIVIEAKAYRGRIEPKEGSAKEDLWRHYPEPKGPGLPIVSEYTNPYKQVRKYTDGARNRIEADKRPKGTPKWGKIYSYGIVVFPEGSDLSAIEPGIADFFYRVATLDRLVETIEMFNEDAKEGLRVRGGLSNRPSPKQVEDLLLGRYIEPPRRAALESKGSGHSR